MIYLFFRDLALARRRIGAVVALLAVVMTLLFVMNGLVNQFNKEPELATHSIGGDRHWVVSGAITGPLTTPVIDERLADVDGIPIALGMSSLDGDRAFLIGRDELADAPSGVVGTWPTSAGELVVDVSTGLARGDTVQLGGRDATVVGTVDDSTVLAGVPLVFTTLDHARLVLAGGRERALVGVLTDEPTADLPTGVRVMSSAEVAADGLVPLENAVSTVTLVNSLLWFIAIVVTAAATYLTAIERTRQFAVLKAVGANGRMVGLSMLLQGVGIALLAAGIAAILQNFVAPLFPMTVRVPTAAYLRIPLVAAAAALLAGIAGTRHAIGVQPSEAFA